MLSLIDAEQNKYRYNFWVLLSFLFLDFTILCYPDIFFYILRYQQGPDTRMYSN